MLIIIIMHRLKQAAWVLKVWDWKTSIFASSWFSIPILWLKRLKPWDAKEVENVDEAHANRVQADDYDDDTHVDDDDGEDNVHVHEDEDDNVSPGKGLEIRSTGPLPRERDMEEHRTVRHLRLHEYQL